MEILSKNLKKILIWATAYINLIAFLLTGGFFLTKDDDDIKGSVKLSLYLVLGWLGVDIINSFIMYLLDLSKSGGYANILLVFNILKIICFITFLVLDLCNVNILKSKVIKRVRTDRVDIPYVDDNKEEKDENQDNLD